MIDPAAKANHGLGTLDLLIALVILALLAALAVPAVNGFMGRAKVAKAIEDVAFLSQRIESYRRANDDRMPGSLVDLGMGIPMDPWEQPYEFVNIQAVGTEDANLRRDGRLHLLNTDYDLYSRGKDGETAVPLEAESSRDDVVRASNGAFIGLGADY